MSIITLISDFGLKDHYMSSVKGAIYSRLPNAVIIDISHQVEKYNIQSAAYILKNAYTNFPKKTVHIVAINTEFINTAGYVAVEHDDHYFIAADNGIFSLLFEELPNKIIELPVDSNTNLSFPSRDIFTNAAVKLANGADVSTLGKPKTKLLQRLPFRASSLGNIIRGAVIYIDSYDNVITNIDKTLFDTVGKKKSFVIELKGQTIDKINNDYNEVPQGEILALFNSSGFLEIAIRNGKASELLHLKITEQITIIFA